MAMVFAFLLAVEDPIARAALVPQSHIQDSSNAGADDVWLGSLSEPYGLMDIPGSPRKTRLKGERF